MVRRAFAAVALVLALIVAGGLSGASFYLWPTGVSDRELDVTAKVIQDLRELRAERKFGPDPTGFYFGARNEIERAEAQRAVDATIDALIADLPKRPRRSTVLRIMKEALAAFDTPESEERDQFLVYLTRAMRVCGVESSSGLFNVRRYGFPYAWFM